MSWQELKSFAGYVSQNCEMVLVATEGPVTITKEDVRNDKFDDCKVAIVEFDTCDWEIITSDSVVLEYPHAA